MAPPPLLRQKVRLKKMGQTSTLQLQPPQFLLLLLLLLLGITLLPAALTLSLPTNNDPSPVGGVGAEPPPPPPPPPGPDDELGEEKPDCEDRSRSCTAGFRVNYGGHEMKCSEKVDPDVAGKKPELSFDDGAAKDDETAGGQFVFNSDEPEDILVVMVDPDAPLPKEQIAEERDEFCPQKYYLHWVMVGEVEENGEIIPKDEMVEYRQPTPPPETGEHRYQLLLYTLGEGDLEKVVENSIPVGKPPKRPGFDLEMFNEKLGLPFATFQFRAED